MANILRVKNVRDYTRYMGSPAHHALIDVVDYTQVSPVRHSLNAYSVYGIFFHDEAKIDLTYGCGKYDYKEGTLICVAPGQIGGKEDNGEQVMLTGWALLFHPDILRGTPLEKRIKDYSFFDYRINEALHMNREEHDLLNNFLHLIRSELERPHDNQQESILVSYIEIVLGYCQRFYNRQFLTRKLENRDLLVRFDAVLQDYYEGDDALSNGLPTVQYCAGKLCMSANYFGDLIKRTTQTTANSYIKQFVIDQAKDRLAAGETVANVAYVLGFEYPQHLSRLFKNVCGYMPSEYLKKLKNHSK